MGGIISGTMNHNIILINCSVTYKSLGQSAGGIIGKGAGGIIGKDTGKGYCHIINCVSNGNINGKDSGGIVGSNSINCLIENCYTYGNISNGGGIVGGNSNGNIIYCCYTTGSISNGGGICGNNTFKNTILNCYTIGNINNTSGGICGKDAKDTVIENCYTIGKIQDRNSGGLLAKGSSNITIINSISQNLKDNEVNKAKSTSGVDGKVNNLEQLCDWKSLNALKTVYNTIIPNTWIRFNKFYLNKTFESYNNLKIKIS